MDPFVLPYIMVKKGITLEQALAECSKSGGLKGLSGISADMREIKEAIAGAMRVPNWLGISLSMTSNATLASISFCSKGGTP
jgi:acetate kinase